MQPRGGRPATAAQAPASAAGAPHCRDSHRAAGKLAPARAVARGRCARAVHAAAALRHGGAVLREN